MRNQQAVTDGLTNDFAQWARTSLHKEDLADRLSVAEITDCRTLGDLREALGEIVRAYMETNPQAADEAAEHPFDFCEGMEVAVPLESAARTLEVLSNGYSSEVENGSGTIMPQRAAGRIP
jgi:hypothetical protein